MKSEHPTLGLRLYRAASNLLLVGIVAYLLWRIYSGRDALFALDPNWAIRTLLLSAAAAALAYQALFYAWLMMLRRAGYLRPGHTRRYARIWWKSFMYRYVPGKVLLVVERARLGKAVGIPPAAGAAMPFIETLLSVFAGSTVSLLAIPYYLGGDGGAITAVALVAITIVLTLPAAYRWFCDLPWVRHRYPELTSLAFSGLDLLVLVTPFLAHYLLLGTAFYWLASMVHPLDAADLPGICGIFALSHVIGLVAIFAPGGIGVREGALAIQLQRLLPAGVAGALAIGVRGWFMLVELGCYAAVLAISRSDAPGEHADRSEPGASAATDSSTPATDRETR